MLWVEFLALYGVLPALVAGFVRPERAQRLLSKVGFDWISFETGLPRGTFVFPVLLITFLVMFLWLRLDKGFDNQRLWNWGAFKDSFRRIVIRFAIAGPFLAGAAWWLAYKTPLLAEQGFFYLPRERPGLMLAIACLYPWVSAYPQEVTHRAFFFHRYAPIMGIGRMAFYMNVIAFVWLHAPMWELDRSCDDAAGGCALCVDLPQVWLDAGRWVRARDLWGLGVCHRARVFRVCGELGTKNFPTIGNSLTMILPHIRGCFTNYLKETTCPPPQPTPM